jgi:hypothetical protein
MPLGERFKAMPGIWKNGEINLLQVDSRKDEDFICQMKAQRK